MNETIRDLGGPSAREEVTLTASAKTGDIVFTGDGRAAIIYDCGDLVSGDTPATSTNALVKLDSASATLFSVGQDVFWDVTNKVAVVAQTAASRLVGRCVVAKTNGQTSVLTRLNGAGTVNANVVHNLRRRLTVAEVNAGTNVLPAIPGFRYRYKDASAIAVGGAVTGSTTVDITGTQSASVVKLLAITVAALTQSALVRSGATNAAILANGASYIACDANTPITVSKTGSDAATATHVDVSIDYTIEPA
jgi:hypothetical protein